MKRIPCYLLLITLSLLPFAARAGTAQARLYCLSVKFHQLRNAYGDTMTLTSSGLLGDASEGELVMPFPIGELTLPGPESYASSLWFYDSYWDEMYSGSLYLSIPWFTDANNNRHPDFFEASQAVNGATSTGNMIVSDPYYGTYTDFLNVTWNRPAGSTSGTCTIDTNDDYWLIFSGTFEILEYTGTLTYTPGTNTTSATVNLTQTGNPSSVVSGPIQFTKSTTDHYNELTNNPGAWPGASLSTLNTFTNHYFSRSLDYPTNYAGYIEFTDGSPWWYQPYGSWALSITDTNDVNHNGYPDFIDDYAGLPPARQPELSLTKGDGNLELSIHGDVGHVHEIQATDSLSSPNWQPVQSVTLSIDPQPVTLSLPSGTRFWRVIAQ